MTFLQMKQRLARRRGDNASSLQTLANTRYGEAINEAQRALLRAPGMESLRYGFLTIASVANQQTYAMPTSGVARTNRIWDPAGKVKLKYRTLEWFRTVDPAPDAGTPWAWVPIGFVEVMAQPSTASSVFVKSSSASDTAIVAYVEGITTGGLYRTDSVTLTGVTPVNFTAVSTWVQITKLYISAAAVGTVTLQETSVSTTAMAQIPIGRTRAQYYGFLLYPTPAAVVTYSADILRSIPDMSNDTDEPLLPTDFHDLLIDGAELKELRKADDPHRWQMLKDAIKDGTRDFESFVKSHPDWRPNFTGTPAVMSSLGGWFPADTVLPG